MRRKTHTKSSKAVRGRNSVDAEDTSHSVIEASTRTTRAIWFLSVVYHRLGSHLGVLGVKGKYFHVVLICRELVEVALQTAQAIRMSKYLPRLLLNRFYVSLLVVNCCSSVFVYSQWFWRDEARRRLVAIVCDCVLNLMTTIGVSLIIVLSYVDEYDTNNFDWRLLEDDEWVSQVLNEARVVMVMSWFDLITRAIFTLGLVATTTDMKALVRYAPARLNQVVNAVGPNIILTRNFVQRKTEAKISPGTPSKARTHSEYKGTGLNTRCSRLVLQGVHYAFAAWGVVIFALHVHAAMQTPLYECTPKVYPMAGALPSCYTVSFDCDGMGFSGSRGEVKLGWDRFDRSTAVKLRILHCRSLEVPDIFQDFGILQEFVIYNSTIVDWGDAAAITNTHHPQLRQMTVARVNMTGGTLPLGFQSIDFPVNMIQMNFCETNLETLPDDLDAKWPAGSVVCLENSNLATVPLPLIRSQPYYLSVAGNPITELPPELFEGNIGYIFVGNTQVNELPGSVIPTTIATLDVTNTNISFFPSWIDAPVEAFLGQYPMLVAGGSAYCSDLEQITTGTSSEFRSSFQPEHSALLMNASQTNWEMLVQAVDCSPPLSSAQFSLASFDATYGLGDGNTGGSKST
ncbi:Centrosomal protein of 41 kDa [Phytophthora pseudosyringae]|uniref:Centrosomal protein of 41 kDa n=1 Tax=Phytophthora pseudosyringae TaxID=221518 RepID=A0A8T1VGM1_9STRA|nr:Centrosomal protein of 41 kDa [Phytophthora pseudosyringae]